MGRRKIRRQQRGSAWHWKQTDCWYYTMPGTKTRVALFDEAGERIRGRHNHAAAEAALKRIHLAGLLESAETSLPPDQWLVANVCSEYIQYCQRGLANGTISKSHLTNTIYFLNDLCTFCGAMQVVELKKGHICTWLQSHQGWKSSATHRGVLSIVLAAFNYADEMFHVISPLKGLRKPPSVARLQSFSAQEERAIYRKCDQPLRDFLFAAIHTGLRPFCELARAHGRRSRGNGPWHDVAGVFQQDSEDPQDSGAAGGRRAGARTAANGAFEVGHSAVPQFARQGVDEVSGRRSLYFLEEKAGLGL